MARIRTIKPEFWSDGDMFKISRDARLFYIGLWNFADDNGVLENDLLSLKAKIFPNDEIVINKLLTELSKVGKVVIYKIKKKSYILLKNLKNHQKIDRPRKSILPLPDEISRNQMKSDEISSVLEGRGRDSIGLESKGKESKGRDGMEGKGTRKEDFIKSFPNLKSKLELDSNDGQ